jgi:hypothetical protein
MQHKTAAHDAAGSITAGKAALLLLLSIGVFFLPVIICQNSLLAASPEGYLTGTARELLGYYSADPTGCAIELSYAAFSKKQLLEGHIPLWSPYQGFGHPFLPDVLLSALFAPLNAFRLILPTKYWSFVFILNLLVGCYSVFLLCRSYRLSTSSSMIAALTYAALGTTQIYLIVSSITLVGSWFLISCTELRGFYSETVTREDFDGCRQLLPFFAF